MARADADPEMARLLGHAPAPADYWDRPVRERSGWIWVDPATASADVLLPSTGAWRVAWSHSSRGPPGKHSSIEIVYGMGETEISVSADGERHAIAIDPEALEGLWSGGR